MRVPRYWAKQMAKTVAPNGLPTEVGCWGWSETNEDEARTRAAKSAERLSAGPLTDQSPGHYWYDERLPREEIIDEFTDESGDVKAFVTRNAYGAIILNTRDLMFIDIDLPQQKPPAFSVTRIIAKLLGGEPPATPDPVADRRAAIDSAARQHPDLGFRVYRTHSGFRVLVGNRTIHAESTQAITLLEQFGADPLYVRMCKNQDCFRARLTPKAWRCGLSPPPGRFPFPDEKSESTNREWEQSYQQTITGYSTCHLVETIGNTSLDPSVADMIDLHDRLTKAESEDPLA